MPSKIVIEYHPPKDHVYNIIVDGTLVETLSLKTKLTEEQSNLLREFCEMKWALK